MTKLLLTIYFGAQTTCWTRYHTNVSNCTYMMSVVGKSTCSGFKTGLYMSYHGGNVVSYIKKGGYFLKDAEIPGYFDTKYMTVLE